jgi:NTE family protein
MESLAMVPAWRRPGLYDLSPLLGSLGQLADFAGLDRGRTRLTVHATDLGTGEAVRFDSHERPIKPIHVQGSTTLIPDFVPVEVEGRLLCDGGYSENLPLRAALGAMPKRPLLCLAVDLMAAERPPRWSLDGMAERQQDLHFASQTRAPAAAVTAELTLAAECSKHPAPPVVLAHLVYRGREDAGSQKAYDYSPRSISARWSHGLEDGRAMAETLAGLSVTSGSGVTVLRFPLPEHAPEPNRAKAA